jgi:hypothetical protein
MSEDYNQLKSRVSHGEVGISLLVTSGRNGANLLQSLLDGHPQVLMIPSYFWFYFDWEFLLNKSAHKVPRLITDFLDRSSFSSDTYTTGLGEARDEFFDIQRDAMRAELTEMLHDTDRISRADFLLAIHVAYARVKCLDLNQIRAIVQHHHFPVGYFGYRYLTHHRPLCMFNTSAVGEYRLRDQMFDDFPKLNIIHMVRNPFDSYNSMLRSIKNDDGTFDVSAYYFNLFGILSGYDELTQRVQALPQRFRVVKFEDLHLRTENTMRSLAGFLDIDYHPCLLQSTIDGKLWWGNNPQKPINGTSPKMVSEAWRSSLEADSLSLCAGLFNPLASNFGYQKLSIPQETNANKWIAHEKTSWLQHLKACFLPGMGFRARLRRVVFFIMYPRMRKKLINHYLNTAIE